MSDRQQNWFARARAEWIAEMLAIYGYINREHLVRKFGISVPQASLDLRRFADAHPHEIAYDPVVKRYVAMNGVGQ